MPSVDGYFIGLPDGWESYPTCRARASLLGSLALSWAASWACFLAIGSHATLAVLPLQALAATLVSFAAYQSVRGPEA